MPSEVVVAFFSTSGVGEFLCSPESLRLFVFVSKSALASFEKEIGGTGVTEFEVTIGVNPVDSICEAIEAKRRRLSECTTTEVKKKRASSISRKDLSAATDVSRFAQGINGLLPTWRNELALSSPSGIPGKNTFEVLYFIGDTFAQARVQSTEATSIEPSPASAPERSIPAVRVACMGQSVSLQLWRHTLEALAYHSYM